MDHLAHVVAKAEGAQRRMTTIALDPLIAEAKERARRRRWCAGAAAAAVAAGLAYAAWSAWPGGDGSFVLRSPGQVTRVPGSVDIAAARAQRPIDYVSNSDGVTWASSDGGGMWVTTDAGGSWRAAAPRDPADFVSNLHVDKWHGWIPVLGGIDRTVDGGRTWLRSIPPGCSDRCQGLTVSFLDARHGFALDAGYPSAKLFETNDGGRTWKLDSHTSAIGGMTGAITFVNRRVAFFGSNFVMQGPYFGPPLAGLYRTTDGGRSWSKYDLAGLDTLVQLPVRVFGRTVVIVQDGPSAGQTATSSSWNLNPGTVWVSRDAGAHWIGRPVPLPATYAAESSLSIVSPRVWFFAFGAKLFGTADGGAHWREISVRGLPQHWGISQISFTSSRVGWAVLPVAQYSETLFRTTDGGRHWTPAGPRVPTSRKHG
jgi:photosystem II stability/assembly factor-like uncharacterized protein